MSYLVKAVTADDTLTSLVIEADTEAGATAHVQAQGYTVLSVNKRIALPSLRTPHRRKFSPLLFSQELLALLAAGLSLVEALAALKSKQRYQTEGVVEGLAKSLSEGFSFSTAVARYPSYFSALYVASMQASEKTGNLQEALRRYIEYQEQMDRIRKKIVSACMYPTLLLGTGALVILFLLFYVVPRFALVYEAFSGTLPFFSKLLVVLGTSISRHGELIALFVVGAAAVLVLLARHRRMKVLLYTILNAVPAIAENARLYELARLYRTLGMLLKGGIPITQAMTMVESLLGPSAQERLRKGHRLITEGRAISSALAECGLTTPIAERMLAVGERTGDMGHIMERVALFHEEDLARWVEDFSKLFEPALMLFIGLVVGTIVVMMYMPIFELATAVQR